MRGMSGAIVNSEEELKTRFAQALLLKPDDLFGAAFSVFPNDTGKALQIASLWKNDPFVKLEMIRLMSDGDGRAYLPSKEQQCKDIYEIANSDKVDEEIRLKAHRLFAELMGHIEKPAAANNNILVNQGVMIVRDHGTDNDWEAKTMAQQTKLIEASRC